MSSVGRGRNHFPRLETIYRGHPSQFESAVGLRWLTACTESRGKALVSTMMYCTPKGQTHWNLLLRNFSHLHFFFPPTPPQSLLFFTMGPNFEQRERERVKIRSCLSIPYKAATIWIDISIEIQEDISSDSYLGFFHIPADLGTW